MKRLAALLAFDRMRWVGHPILLERGAPGIAMSRSTGMPGQAESGRQLF